jgi:hypothetical protein
MKYDLNIHITFLRQPMYHACLAVAREVEDNAVAFATREKLRRTRKPSYQSCVHQDGG